MAKPFVSESIPSFIHSFGRVTPHGENQLSMTGFRCVETPPVTAMKTPQKNLILLVLTSIFFAVTGTSCRTVQGFGSDVEHTGDHIKDAASR
jgi:predicted small secreted protein